MADMKEENFKLGLFNIGTHMAGAPQLTARLTVQIETSTCDGRGELDQAVSPPLHIVSSFNGQVHVLGGGKAHQVFALRGNPLAPLTGAPVISDLFISLDGIWGIKGTASYTYLMGSEIREIRDAPVAVNWRM